MKRIAVIILIIALTGLAAGFFFSSGSYKQRQADQEKQNLPTEENVNLNAKTNTTNDANDNANGNANLNTTNDANNVNANDNTNTTNVANLNANANTSTSALPAEKNFAVPFTSQAPHANWDLDHNEFCEEASVLMVGRFWKGLPITTPDDTEEALQKIKAWELDNLGFYYDTTAAETAKILEGLYGLKTRLIQNPTIDDIKTELAAGRPVIVPAAGRELGNPYYTPPGPIYHMVVIKGYTADGKFITNDPGTRNGADYVFGQKVVMNAMHDWVPGEDRTAARNGTPTGMPVAIIAEVP